MYIRYHTPYIWTHENSVGFTVCVYISHTHTHLPLELWITHTHTHPQTCIILDIMWDDHIVLTATSSVSLHESRLAYRCRTWRIVVLTSSMQEPL